MKGGAVSRGVGEGGGGMYVVLEWERHCAWGRRRSGVVVSCRPSTMGGWGGSGEDVVM